jgi:hypothetical protein
MSAIFMTVVSNTASADRTFPVRKYEDGTIAIVSNHTQITGSRTAFRGDVWLSKINGGKGGYLIDTIKNTRKLNDTLVSIKAQLRPVGCVENNTKSALFNFTTNEYFNCTCKTGWIGQDCATAAPSPPPSPPPPPNVLNSQRNVFFLRSSGSQSDIIYFSTRYYQSDGTLKLYDTVKSMVDTYYKTPTFGSFLNSMWNENWGWNGYSYLRRRLSVSSWRWVEFSPPTGLYSDMTELRRGDFFNGMVLNKHANEDHYEYMEPRNGFSTSGETWYLPEHQYVELTGGSRKVANIFYLCGYRAIAGCNDASGNGVGSPQSSACAVGGFQSTPGRGWKRLASIVTIMLAASSAVIKDYTKRTRVDRSAESARRVQCVPI